MVNLSVKGTLFTVIVWQGIQRILEMGKLQLSELTDFTEKQKLSIEIITLMIAVAAVYYMC